jgi:hypothetical protein
MAIMRLLVYTVVVQWVVVQHSGVVGIAAVQQHRAGLGLMEAVAVALEALLVLVTHKEVVAVGIVEKLYLHQLQHIHML